MTFNVKDENNICISVRDFGPGIPVELQGSLYEPNSHEARVGLNGERGIGYGLSIVKSTLIYLGGEIKHISMPQDGTLFQVTLPLS